MTYEVMKRVNLARVAYPVSIYVPVVTIFFSYFNFIPVSGVICNSLAEVSWGQGVVGPTCLTFGGIDSIHSNI